MSKTQQTENEMRVNKPIELFTIKGPNGKAKKIETPIISIDAVDKWYDSIEKVSDAEKAVKAAATGDVKTLIEAKKKFAAAVFDAICSYNPGVLKAQELKGKVSVLQATDAFLRLRELSDPFDQLQLGYSRAVREQLAGLDQDLIKTLKELGSSNTPEPQPSSD